MQKIFIFLAIVAVSCSADKYTWAAQFIDGLHQGMNIPLNDTLLPLIQYDDLNYLGLYDNYNLIRQGYQKFRDTAIQNFGQIFKNFTLNAGNRSILFSDGNFTQVFNNINTMLQSPSYFQDKAMRYQRRSGRDAYSDIWTQSGYLFWERDWRNAGWNFGEIIIALLRTTAPSPITPDSTSTIQFLLNSAQNKIE